MPKARAPSWVRWCTVEIGVGVISVGMGGIEEEVDVFHGECRGIKGVSKGNERAVGETIGATAGVIVDEDTTVPVLTGGDSRDN